MMLVSTHARRALPSPISEFSRPRGGLSNSSVWATHNGHGGASPAFSYGHGAWFSYGGSHGQCCGFSDSDGDDDGWDGSGDGRKDASRN